jgi:tetratricopeptide (TPR) repeat protein
MAQGSRSRRRQHRDRSHARQQQQDPPLQGRRRLIVTTLAVLVACAVAGAAAVLRWGWPGHRPTAAEPVLPSLRLEGVDPVLAEAIEEAEAAVRDAPSSAAAWGKLGQVLYVHAIGGPALECFARASDLDPSDPRWPYLRGRTIARENGDAALPFLRKAAEMCHGSPPAPSLLLAELLLERGEMAEAAPLIGAVLARDPADARALLARARLEITRREWDGARQDLEACIARTPDVKVAHLLLAKVYARDGASSAGDRETRRAASLPDSTPPWPDPFIEEMSPLAIGRSALLERAERLMRQGQPGPAIVALEALASRYPADTAVAVTLAQAYRQDGRLAQAEAAFRSAIAKRPDSVDAQLGLGRTLCDQNRFADALVPLREAVRMNPNVPETHYQLALALLGEGDRPRGIQALQEAVRVEPSFRSGYVSLGNALAGEAGRKNEAAAALRRALELDPDDAATAALLKQVEQVPPPSGGS